MRFYEERFEKEEEEEGRDWEEMEDGVPFF